MTGYDGTDQGHTPGAVDGPTTAHLEAVSDGDRLPQGGDGGTPVQAAAAIDALPPDSALLVVQHGPNTGARFLLDADVTSAGRDTRSEIFLDDVTVSRRHAEFRRVGDGFEVRDVGSLNGTYVNRERIEGAALRSGDEVQIGKFRLTFHPSPHRAPEGR
ncbi:FHA domain-containing protein [Litorihabitans aurantiacus]|uniref:Phosphopeptide-binding protein n=1 Tax=Litorihabitans aurantiacus TaxID=1930061 RepID=A0AA37UPH0_9MICO|nr:FHA domain-containing protein [Litorihabitans aurantiacus]GMA31249.1 phosphopeptide-binding protein [Litorihabitans aurantiacus]